MAEINWNEEAQIWLRNIYDYIVIDNPAAAARTVLGVFQKAQLLTNHPGIGYKHEAAGNEKSASSFMVITE